MIQFPHISPELFKIGPVAVRWYGLMYVVGFIIGFQIFKLRARQGFAGVNYKALESYMTHLVVGMLLGSRLTYVTVYNWGYYSEHFVEILYLWKGGLSFHGALAGLILASVYYARKIKTPFYQITDTLAYGGIVGLFFGRMGNFINGELWGRETTVPWGMIFPGDPDHLVRHPSQLYQGFVEGILGFLVLYTVQKWVLKRGKYHHGVIGSAFLIWYGVGRIFTELFREPDKQLGFFGILTMGQILSGLTALGGLFVLWHSSKLHGHFVPQPPPKEWLLSDEALGVEALNQKKAKKLKTDPTILGTLAPLSKNYYRSYCEVMPLTDLSQRTYKPLASELYLQSTFKVGFKSKS